LEGDRSEQKKFEEKEIKNILFFFQFLPFKKTSSFLFILSSTFLSTSSEPFP
jgi:hypothetical protein